MSKLFSNLQIVGYVRRYNREWEAVVTAIEEDIDTGKERQVWFHMNKDAEKGREFLTCPTIDTTIAPSKEWENLI